MNINKVSDVLAELGLEPKRYMLLSAHREENIDTEANFTSLFTAINSISEKYDMPILYSCHPRSRKRLEATGFSSTCACACTSPWASTTTTSCR